MRRRGSGLGCRAGSQRVKTEDCGRAGLRKQRGRAGRGAVQSGVLRASPASCMSRSCPSAAAFIRAVAARRCSLRRRVGTSGLAGSNSGLWSCSFKEPTTTGDMYLRAQHPESSGCSLPSFPTDPHSRPSPTPTGLSQLQSSRAPPPVRHLRPCGSPRTPSQAVQPRSPALG